MAHRSNKFSATDLDSNQSGQGEISAEPNSSSVSENTEADQEPEPENADEALRRTVSVESLNAMTDTSLFAAGANLAFQGREGVVSSGLSVPDRLAEEQLSRRIEEAALQCRVVELTMRMIQQAREEQADEAGSMDESDYEDTNETQSPSTSKLEERPDEGSTRNEIE